MSDIKWNKTSEVQPPEDGMYRIFHRGKESGLEYNKAFNRWFIVGTDTALYYEPEYWR